MNNIANPDLIITGDILKIEPAPAVELEQRVKEQQEPQIPEIKIKDEARAKQERCRGWRVGGVYAGGGGQLQAGTDFKLGPIVLNASFGAGLGQNYTMGNFQLSKEFGLPGDYRLGFSGVYAYYSKFIINVPWTNQSLDKGSNFGLGAYLAKDINDWELKAGYSPLLGPNAGVSKYF